jgi:hypothetical protein
MLNQAKLPPSFWGAAVLYLTEILNRTPSTSVADTTSVANSPQMQSRQRRAECGAARAMTVDAKSCIAQKVRYNTGTGQGRLSTCIAQKRSGKERGKLYQQVYKGKNNKASECR